MPTCTLDLDMRSLATGKWIVENLRLQGIHIQVANIYMIELTYLFIRKIDALHCEMTCTFENFNAELLKSFSPVSYKYVVHSTKEVERDDCFEYLHTQHRRHGNVDRCLMIPPEKLLKLYNGGESV